MKKYKLTWGLTGGLRGTSETCTELFEDPESAAKAAWENACELYESYSRRCGSRSIEQIMEDDGVSEQEADSIYNEERESWITYEAEEVEESANSEAERRAQKGDTNE